MAASHDTFPILLHFELLLFMVPFYPLARRVVLSFLCCYTWDGIWSHPLPVELHLELCWTQPLPVLLHLIWWMSALFFLCCLPGMVFSTLFPLLLLLDGGWTQSHPCPVTLGMVVEHTVIPWTCYTWDGVEHTVIPDLLHLGWWLNTLSSLTCYTSGGGWTHSPLCLVTPGIVLIALSSLFCYTWRGGWTHSPTCPVTLGIVFEHTLIPVLL